MIDSLMKLPVVNFLMGALCLLFLTGCGGGDEVPTDPVAKLIYERQHHFKDMGKAFKFIDDELQERYPDFAKIEEKANELHVIGQDLPQWFPAGSGPESGFETAAKAEVWLEPAKFDETYQEFVNETQRLIASAKLADKSAVTAQYHTTGVTCSNCHKPFRVKED